MGKKIRSEMEAQRNIFISKAIAKGVEEEQAVSIFELLAKFAEYGFNKSHAAAYALISYQTAYMKANYPVEFLAASMTYDIHNTDKLALFREEAARFNIEMLPPDINASDVFFAPEGKNAIRYGLAAIRNVGDAAMRLLVEERDKNGVFRGIWDMAARLPAHVMNRRQMEYLIKAGAFDSMHKNRNQLLGGLDMIIGYNATTQREKESQQVSLFGDTSAQKINLPALPVCDDWLPMERMENENEALGFYLSSHPMHGYRGALTRIGVVASRNFSGKLGTGYSSMKVAGLVSKIKIRSGEKGRFAFVSMSDEFGAFEIAIFKEDILNRYRPQLTSGTMIVAQVDGKREENGARLILQSLQPLEEAVAEVAGLAMPKKLHITINSPIAATKLKMLLGEANGAGTKITLLAAIEENQKVEIALKGQYALSPNILMQIPTMEGVVTSSEAA
jgi:DNA polymerase-3 subunit alpha